MNKCRGYDAKLPMWVQDVLSATLGSLAKALGYKAISPQFVSER